MTTVDTIVDVPIERHKRYDIEQYCVKNIAPRRYYLHNAVGGTGWMLHQSQRNDWYIQCSEQHAIIIKLKYGC